MRVDGVIFDYDGLLVDSERIYRFCDNFIDEYYGKPIYKMAPDTFGVNTHDAEKIFKDTFGQDFDYWKMHYIWLGYSFGYFKSQGLPVKPGAIELLEYLKKEQIPYTICTASVREDTLMKLKIAGLDSYFDRILCGDEYVHGKPNPECFIKAAEMLGTKPENTVVFEDSRNGIMAAERGGFISCMVPDLQTPTEEILKNLTRQFKTLHEGIDFIRECNHGN